MKLKSICLFFLLTLLSGGMQAQKENGYKVNAARKSKVDDNTARMQSIKQLGV